LRDCDLCVIPVDVANRAKSVKSANRLVEALRAGRFVVASPLPAYREFSESALVGEDIAQGIAWAVDHPAEVAARIRAGQLMVEQYYSPAAIAQQWLQTLASLAG
jgi:glycosyltransferase involved in cell wall biosynthesis